MIYNHTLSPVFLDLGPVQIHWYGLMYICGFLTALLFAYLRRQRLNLDFQFLWDCMFWLIVSILIGGRVGYMFFYAFDALIANPLSIFFVWQGGMSFHGAAIGVVLGFFFFARSRRMHPFDLSDFILSTSALGLAFGRLGNFINGELWGAETGGNWGVIFPAAPSDLPRHPTQLYEALLEGVLLFALLWLFTLKPRPRMTATGLFLLGYGSARFVIEFIRQPDAHIGYIAFGWLTMGQVLSAPMILAGLALFAYGWHKNVMPNYSAS